MASAPHEPATNSHLSERQVIKLLESAVIEPQSIEDRIWSKLQKQVADNRVIESPKTLLDQLEGIVKSNALLDVLQSLAACCDARATLLDEDLYWSKVAVLIRRAVPLATKLRCSARL